MPDDTKVSASNSEAESSAVDDKGVPLKNRLEELKRKNEKLEKEYQAGKQELVSMRQELDGFKAIAAEIKTFKERQDKPAAKVDPKELDAMFYANPSEMTRRVVEETLAEKFLPEVKKLFETGLSGVEGKISNKEKTAVYSQQALSEFPALSDAESEFYQETTKAYEELSVKPGLKDDPELVYLAAQRAAARRPDLAKKAKEEYSPAYGGSQFEQGGYSPRRRVNKNEGPSQEDKQLAEEANMYLKDLGIKITPEKIKEQRKAALAANPKLGLYMEKK